MKAMVRFSYKNSYDMLPQAQLAVVREQGDFGVLSFRAMERIRCFDGSGDR